MSLLRTSVEASQAGDRSAATGTTVGQLRDIHNRRIETLTARDEAFVMESNAMANFLRNEPEIPEVPDTTEIRYKYPLTATQTFYSTIGGHNIPGYSYCYPAKLKCREKGIQWIIAKEVQIKNFRVFPSQFLQAYTLLKYFSTMKKLFNQRIFDIFRVRSKNVYVFFFTLPIEYQSIRSALLNGRIVNSAKQVDDESISLDLMIQQILSATEQLNLCGVAHRFINVDNVFLSPEKTIQFGSFDFATVFWNPVDQVKILCSKALGMALPNEYNEHLPPEAFTPTGYDASMVDVWSIGVMLCRILIGATPFEPLTRMQIYDVDKYLKHWRESECRAMIPDAYRLFIDEVFRPMNERMTLSDLLNDPFWNKKSSKRLYPYYRIDIREGINTDAPPKWVEQYTAEVVINRPTQKVSDEVKKAFHSKDQFKFAEKFEDIQDYMIDVQGSFSDEFKVQSDTYIKAIRNKNNVPCLLRVFCHSFPSRYRKLMASESCKITKLCQTSPNKAFFHEIYDVFITPSGKNLWVFYENIINYRPLSVIVTQPTEQVLVRQLVHWWSDLIHAIQIVSEFISAHRYVRPEYVLIHPETLALKLSHSDMAGFSLNPEHEKISPRSYGMQDENEAMWNHLPPEAFEPRYDISGLDVWSFGVLVCFCMTRGRFPFTCEQLRANWMTQWIRYRTRFASNLEIIPELTDYLNKIFQDFEQRTTIAILERRLKDLTNKKVRSEVTPDSKIKKKYNSNTKLSSKVPSKTRSKVKSGHVTPGVSSKAKTGKEYKTLYSTLKQLPTNFKFTTTKTVQRNNGIPITSANEKVFKYTAKKTEKLKTAPIIFSRAKTSPKMIYEMKKTENKKFESRRTDRKKTVTK